MMKKFISIIMLFSLVLLTGCDATYEINIKDDKIIENLKLIETDKSVFDKKMSSGWTARDLFKSILSKDEFVAEEYKMKDLTNDNQLGINYSSSSNKKIINSSILHQCYTNPTIKELDGIITIDTGSNFECYDYYENLDNVKVVLKTNHEIVSTNADIVDGNSYIWNITKNGNKQIQFSYYESIVNKSINPMPYIYTLCIVGLVGFCSYFVIKKRKKVNEI